MSLFSGKCDCFDCMVMIGCSNSTEETIEKDVQEYLSKTDIYIGYDNFRLRIKADIKTYKDLVPCFPKLELMSCGDKDKRIVVLSEYSFAEKENQEIWQSKLDHLLKYYRKCKRNKVSFDDDTALKIICYMDYKLDECIELVNRVKTFGEKATIDGLGGGMIEHYRKYLYEECIRVGYREYDSRLISNYKGGMNE